MRRLAKLLVAFALLAFSVPSVSFAQATRTWVSGVGDDVNPCSRTAPCKTFAGAISKTAAGGEIDCLDPGGYGTLTITKSITIDCTGTFGSTLNSGGINGFVINDSATATPNTVEVILRGLQINGAGTTPGLNGVRFISGRSLVLENVFIQNQLSGNGISLQPSGIIEFYAENVTITDGAGGILMQPTGATAGIKATLRNVRVQNNVGTALDLNTSSGVNQFVQAAIEKSTFSGNGAGIAATTPATGKGVVVMVNDSEIAGNNTVGLSASGGTARIRASNSSITFNTTGLTVASGGGINSFGNNRLFNNGTDGSFTSVLPEQ